MHAWDGEWGPWGRKKENKWEEERKGVGDMGWGLLFMTGVVLPFKKKVCVRANRHTHAQIENPLLFWWVVVVTHSIAVSCVYPGYWVSGVWAWYGWPLGPLYCYWAWPFSMNEASWFDPKSVPSSNKKKL